MDMDMRDHAGKLLYLYRLSDNRAILFYPTIRRLAGSKKLETDVAAEEGLGHTWQESLLQRRRVYMTSLIFSL